MDDWADACFVGGVFRFMTDGLLYFAGGTGELSVQVPGYI